MDDAAVVLTHIQSGELATRISKSYKAPLRAVKVPALLSLIGVNAQLIEKLTPYFQKAEFVGDPDGRMNLSNISQGQFLRRLANACMIQLWDARPEMSLPDFLVKYRTQPYRVEEEPAQTRPSLTPVQPKAVRSIEEIQLEKLLSEAEGSKAVITAAIDLGYAKALRTLAPPIESGAGVAQLTGFVEGTAEAALNLLILTTFLQAKQPPSKQPLSKQPPSPAPALQSASLDEVVSLLAGWRAKPDPPSPKSQKSNASATTSESSNKPVEETIEETLRTYEAMRVLAQSNAEETQAIESIIKACRLQLKRATKDNGPPRHRTEKWVVDCKQGLSEIFQFYGKQVRMIGNSPSFAEIDEANQSWTLSKFMKFLKDFGLTEAPDDRRSLSKVETVDIFMQFAHLRKFLGETSFMLVVEAIAETYFDAEYDKVHGTAVSGLGFNEKLYRLYELLECDDVARYTKQMKGFGLPFNSDISCRIPVDDPALRYKFKPIPKEELEDWRRSRLSSLTPKMRRKGSKLNESKAIGKQPVKRQSIDRQPVERRSVDIRPSQKHLTITWKKLEEMSFEHFNDPSNTFDFRELIVDSDSEDGGRVKLPSLKEPPVLQVTPLGQPTEKALTVVNGYSMRARQRLKHLHV
jgi:hypothetical protein